MPWVRWFPIRRLLALCALGFSLVGACSTPTFSFVSETPDAGGGTGGGDSGVGPLVMPTSCAADADCADLAATKTCDLESGQCVECVSDADAGATPCGDGLRCNSSKHCEIGCNTDADCHSGLTCDVATGTCAGCASDADCTTGTTCQGAVCTPGCADATSCPSGWSCCSGACSNPLTDALNCSACNASCGGNDCINGQCGTGSCAPGLAECDGNSTNGCETDVRLDPKNCGKCGLDCGTQQCNGGRCSDMNCPTGFADCDQKTATKCEANLNADVENCGMCGVVCSSAKGTPTCADGTCTITCDKGFADCDKKVATGCETATDANAKNCGDCGVVCKNDNGSTACQAGACHPICAAGFDDCDLNPSNGCEANVRTSLTDCGGCGMPCNLAHASETCDTGVCKIVTCDPGFKDCNGNPGDGCETDLSQPDTCGSCTNKCSTNGGTAVCQAGGVCAIHCNVGRADCANGALDGCETDLNVSVNNCNRCGNKCPATGGTPACIGGVCGVSSCSGTFFDCNGGTDGCETNLSSDPQNCGGCGTACVYPNAVGQCINKACSLKSCNPGSADCTAAAGCETPLGTTTNCASCGNVCTNAHGSSVCSGSPGSYACAPTCAVGFSNCDSNPNNGCETSTLTLTDCGACGMPCSFPNAAASCATGTCTLGACAAGFDDCTAAAGCETALGNTTNCAACGNGCSNGHGSTTCSGGPGTFACAPTCAAGFKSCDSNPSNGCETSITTLTDCGNCGLLCGFPNAGASCSTGTCTMGSCASGFADCTAAAGCETTLGTASNCASCGNTCSNAHGSTSCAGAPGSFDCAPVCSAGFLSCDGNPDNGCEMDVTTTANCGACGHACGGATPYCVKGACVNPVVNSTTNGTNASGAQLDIPHSLQTPAGNARMVVVLIAGDGNTQSDATPTGVIYNAGSINSVPMILAQQIWSGNRAWSGIYYLLDPALPAATGTYTVRITGSLMGKVVNVLELRGIDQASPVLSVGGSPGANCASDDPSDPITTTVNNALILTTVATFGTQVGTPSSLQTETFAGSDGAVGFKAGFLGPVTAATRTITWDMASCNDSAQALLALRPAAP